MDTSTRAYSWDLDMRSEGDDIGTEEPMYLPTSTLAFQSIMRNLPTDVSEYVFVDFGSGKGRTLLLAAEFNFKRIIGVEFARELHDTAVKNVKNYSSASQKCFDLRSKGRRHIIRHPREPMCSLLLQSFRGSGHAKSYGTNQIIVRARSTKNVSDLLQAEVPGDPGRPSLPEGSQG